MAKVDMDRLLGKITKDAIMVSMGDHGFYVGVSISIDIVGKQAWDDLDAANRQILIDKVNYTKLAEKLF